jgi:hypothetical protein
MACTNWSQKQHNLLEKLMVEIGPEVPCRERWIRKIPKINSLKIELNVSAAPCMAQLQKKYHKTIF